MLKFLARELSLKLVINKIIATDKEEYYTYGIELILNDILIFFMISIIAFITNTILISIIFTLTFCTLRSFTGGYHSKSYLGCFFIAFINYSLMLILNYIFSKEKLIIEIFMIILSIPIILVFSPIENVNNPINCNEKQKYKKISYFLVVINIILFIIFSIFFDRKFSFAIAWSVFTTALLMLLSIKSKRKVVELNEKNTF